MSVFTFEMRGCGPEHDPVLRCYPDKIVVIPNPDLATVGGGLRYAIELRPACTDVIMLGDRNAELKFVSHVDGNTTTSAAA